MGTDEAIAIPKMSRPNRAAFRLRVEMRAIGQHSVGVDIFRGPLARLVYSDIVQIEPALRRATFLVRVGNVREAVALGYHYAFVAPHQERGSPGSVARRAVKIGAIRDHSEELAVARDAVFDGVSAEIDRLNVDGEVEAAPIQTARRDADHLAGAIEQRTAATAERDFGVGLNQVAAIAIAGDHARR